MSEISFGDNYNDLSEETGFQFEFYCERCNDAWRNEFKAYLPGKASRLLDAAGGVLGGILGGAGRAADYVEDAGYRAAHDKAFSAAIEQAKQHFHRCRQCGNYVCAKCFNPDLHLCTACAPSLEECADIAEREGEVDRATFAAYREGWSKAHKAAEYIICPACAARVVPAKFCSECGAKLAVKLTCPKCGAKVEASAKFCPECGSKL